MKIKTYTLMLLFVLLISSCGKELISVDFTEKGSFTEGIEGPATDFEGNIYAVNYKEQGTIGKVSSKGEATLFLSLPNGSIGNGIRFGDKDQMFIADYTNHNILEVDLKSRKITVFAHEAEANQPNDVAISPNKTLYASDPNWSDDTGKLWKITKENGFVLLEDKMGTTNGIEVSPNGKKLYVNESIQRKIWVYDILGDGGIANKKEMISFNDHGLDGMRCHKNGNLYVCRYGAGKVAVLSPQGKVVNEINLKGKNPTNITFSNDYKTCYITVSDRGCIEMVNL